MCVQEEMERVDEEDWLLQDVIFVEDSRNIPVGKVLKVTEIPTRFFLSSKFEEKRANRLVFLI
jgi:hypothetical protein